MDYTFPNTDFPHIQILDAMNQDSELPLNSVRVDGGMTDNKLMLQLQADILGIKMGEMNN